MLCAIFGVFSSWFCRMWYNAQHSMPRAPPSRSPCRPAGKRQDNRAAKRPGSLHDKGWRFFEDDEDEYGLEDLLQASQRQLLARLYLERAG